MSRSPAQTSDFAHLEHRRIDGLTRKREIPHLESLESRRLLSAAAMSSALLDGYGHPGHRSRAELLHIPGGTGFDAANDITVDAAGHAYITGQTGTANFPTTVGAASRWPRDP
jgi:hypothetical protein